MNFVSVDELADLSPAELADPDSDLVKALCLMLESVAKKGLEDGGKSVSLHYCDGVIL